MLPLIPDRAVVSAMLQAAPPSCGGEFKKLDPGEVEFRWT